MREVLGRCDSDHLDIGCHSNGDHVLLQALADTDAGVETAGPTMSLRPSLMTLSSAHGQSRRG
jgi:hypothetical protein